MDYFTLQIHGGYRYLATADIDSRFIPDEYCYLISLFGVAV